MVSVATLFTLITQKITATAIGSIAASITLIKLSLNKDMSIGELLSNGTAVAFIGSFLINIVYYLTWSYISELYKVKAMLETFIMVLKSGVFFYMLVLDLLISITAILIVISIVSTVYIGE